jgi:glycerate-2-kinase
MPHTKNFVAGHPIPDAEGVRAAKQVVQLLERAERGDLVLLLLSGGASALMPAPIAGVSLRDKQRLTRMLLRRGASIREINAVRKRLSRLKGGGFTALGAPARVVALALSDVPGDDIGTIGSGPTVVDPNARTVALRTIRKFLREDEGSRAVREALARPNSVRPPAMGTGVVVIGNGRTFARAAAKRALELGFRTVVLPDALRGEARRRGPWLVKRFASYRRRVPLCLIATGETVVKVHGRGRGGRNQELALASVPALGHLGRATLLAAFATDGRDGASLAGGGLVDDRTQQGARAEGVSVETSLDRNDSNAALERLGALITCGPTLTNVADVALVVG